MIRKLLDVRSWKHLGFRAPMNTVDSRKNVAKALEVVAEFVSASAAEAPVDFVRQLARSWKAAGGFLSGKPRHSDRYLDDLLRLQGTQIRSLTPKLVGRTNLKAADAGILVRLFLSHWKYIGDPNIGEITAPSTDLYEPMLPPAEIEEVSEYIADRMTAIGSEAAQSLATASPLLGQDIFELIPNEFRESAALISAATGSPVLVPSPDKAFIGFITLMDKLWAIERADNRGRILIWTMDLGRQVLEDPESRRRFQHIQDLIARFKATKLFRGSDMWSWLQSRAIVVLHDTRSGRPDVAQLPAFDPHHVLFSAIPPRWAGSNQFNDLYGREPAQANYSIFLRPSEQFQDSARRLDQSAIAGQSYTLRYFGHALKSDENGDPVTRGLPLEMPGWSYIEALGTVFIAANQVLGLPGTSAELVIDGLEIDPAHAIEKLRHHGFLVLRLDAFLQI